MTLSCAAFPFAKLVAGFLLLSFVTSSVAVQEQATPLHRAPYGRHQTRFLRKTAHRKLQESTLQVTIQGVPGEGFSTWTFAGTSVATKKASFNGDNWNCCGATSWTDMGASWANSYLHGHEWSGDISFNDHTAITIEIAGQQFSITTLGYGTGVNGTDGNGSLSFATSFSCPPTSTNSGCIPIAEGDIVTWFGTSRAPIDITEFNVNEATSSTLAGLQLEVLIQESDSPAPTPSPTTPMPTSSPTVSPTSSPTPLQNLLVEISGVPNEGFSTWTFAGTSVATKKGSFNGDNWNCCGANSWNDMGADWANSYLDGYEWSGDISFNDHTAITIEIAGQQYSITTLGYGTGVNGTDGSGSLSFATSFSCPPTSTNSGCIPIAEGDIVTWFGTSWAPIDITEFNVDEATSSTFAGLQLDVLIQESDSPAPTPNPTAPMPTSSPTVSPTSSPTLSPTISPTSSPTPLQNLLVEVSGVPDEGFSTWTFAGTSVATKKASFNGDNWNCCGDNSWNDMGANWANSYLDGYEWSGDISFNDHTAITIDIAGQQYTITTLGYGTGVNGTDGNGSLSFATSFSCPPTSHNSGCIPIVEGDIVTWSGSSSAPVDITMFNVNQTSSYTLAGLQLEVFIDRN